jgi:hypothetical protein
MAVLDQMQKKDRDRCQAAALSPWWRGWGGVAWHGMGTRSQDNENRVLKDALDPILSMSVG